MWKPSTVAVPRATTADEPVPSPATPTERMGTSLAAILSAPGSVTPATLGKSITIKGEITGSESLHIEGRVEGAIRLTGAYLNIGPQAVVHSNIHAREVVVRGEVVGNVETSERVDIRNGGSLTGDVAAKSVSIEEGAYFKGSIDMRRSEQARHAPQSAADASSLEAERARAASA
jgi:cytoskeletal protein CcmA (bactofilin family)